MDLIERFKYIMKLNKLTASAFASQIGVQASSVSHVLSGRNKPSLEFIQKVLLAYPKIDSNWLINGTTKVQSKELEFEGNEEVESKKAVLNQENSKQLNQHDSIVSTNSSKQVTKVLIFYTDGTFEEFASTTVSAI